MKLDLNWVPFLDGAWKKHIKFYKDMPSDLESVFNEINAWLALFI